MSTDEPDAEDLAEAFPHVAQLEEDLKEADIDVGDIPQRKGTTRRDLLAGSAGLLGLGGVLTSASGTASAGNDQAGTVGSQAAPLDGYVEDLYDKNGNRVAELPGDGSLDVLQELSSQFVDTDELDIGSAAAQFVLDGMVVPVADGLGVVDAIDPTATADPLGDAQAAIRSTSTFGTIHLPYGIVTQGTTYVPEAGIDIQGRSLGRTAVENKGSVVEFDSSVTTFIDMSNADSNVWDGVTFKGPGIDGTQRTAIKFSSNDTGSLRWGSVEFAGFSGQVIDTSAGGGMYQSQLEYVFVRNVDSGGERSMFDLRFGGPQNSIGMLVAYPQDINSGSQTTLVEVSGMDLTIDHINVGGEVGMMYSRPGGTAGNTKLHSYNYEPNDGGGANVPISVKAADHIGRGKFNGAGTSTPSSDCAIRIDGFGGQYIHRPLTVNGWSFDSNVVDVDFDTSAPGAKYEGPTSDVSNNTGGTLTAPVYCWDGSVT